MNDETFEYGKKVAELEEILAELQQPEISLEKALALHEKGQALLGELEKFLKHAQVEVKKRTAEE